MFDLNQDLYGNLNDHICTCTCTCLRGAETVEHNLFKCKHYTEQRIHLFKEFHSLNFDMLLKGKDSLSDSDLLFLCTWICTVARRNVAGNVEFDCIRS